MSKIHGVIKGVLQKECALCHQVKPVETEFFKAARGLYGRHNYCKECCRLHNARRKGQTPKEPLDLAVCSRPGCKKPPRNRFEKYCSKKCGRAVRDFEKRRELKKQAVALMGGHCVRCGYNKSVAALNFHHRDPDKKEFLTTQKIRPWDEIVVELEKCDLLCANCHREVHALEKKSRNKTAIYHRTWHSTRKRAMINYLGGTCQRCGYKKFDEALAFHHRNPSEKRFEVSQAKLIWEKITPELDKCDLLCFNCHAETHFA